MESFETKKERVLSIEAQEIVLQAIEMKEFIEICKKFNGHKNESFIETMTALRKMIRDKFGDTNELPGPEKLLQDSFVGTPKNEFLIAKEIFDILTYQEPKENKFQYKQ